MSALKTVFAVILAAAALSACSGLGGTFTIDRFLNKEITGDTAGACMARSYQAWARNKAWVQRDYVAAVELAQRAEIAKAATTLTGYYCVDPAKPASDAEGRAHLERSVAYWEIAKKDPAKACACGNAIVEVARWSCAAPGDDKPALQKRLDVQAAACEGR
jgi:hypothetical protein